MGSPANPRARVSLSEQIKTWNTHDSRLDRREEGSELVGSFKICPIPEKSRTSCRYFYDTYYQYFFSLLLPLLYCVLYLTVGIWRALYEATFGCAARVGLLLVGLPGDEVVDLREESDTEDILNLKNDESTDDDAASNINSIENGKHFIS